MNAPSKRAQSREGGEVALFKSLVIIDVEFVWKPNSNRYETEHPSAPLSTFGTPKKWQQTNGGKPNLLVDAGEAEFALQPGAVLAHPAGEVLVALLDSRGEAPDAVSVVARLGDQRLGLLQHQFHFVADFLRWEVTRELRPAASGTIADQAWLRGATSLPTSSL